MTVDGMRWAYGYAMAPPKDPRCGFISNPDAGRVIDLVPCNRDAAYGFHFHGETVVWNGACEEHARVVRLRGEAERIWSLPVRKGGVSHG